MTAIEMEQQLLSKWRSLPPDKQREMLDFAEFLERKMAKRASRNLEGLWADLPINITDQDIVEARKEMWGNFPRDIGA
ncbi:MAG: DUF2281 domain-containing protein [Anaerolineae bacterium]